MAEQYPPHRLAIAAVPIGPSDKQYLCYLKCSGYLRFDCEVHILRNIAGETGDIRRVELRCHNADKVTACIKERSAAIARLYRRTDLKIAIVIAKTRKSTYISN